MKIWSTKFKFSKIKGQIRKTPKTKKCALRYLKGCRYKYLNPFAGFNGLGLPTTKI